MARHSKIIPTTSLESNRQIADDRAELLEVIRELIDQELDVIVERKIKDYLQREEALKA